MMHVYTYIRCMYVPLYDLYIYIYIYMPIYGACMCLYTVHVYGVYDACKCLYMLHIYGACICCIYIWCMYINTYHETKHKTPDTFSDFR